MPPIIHLVDDEQIIHDIFSRIFKKDEYDLVHSENLQQAIRNHHPEVAVTILDLMIPGTSGQEVFTELLARDPAIKAIFLTAYGTIDSAVETIRMGAVDYLQKPFNNLEIKHRIDRIIQERNLERENRHLRKLLGRKDTERPIIGRSQALRKTLTMVEAVAPSSSTVLITGESGTGKELIARALHQGSPRKNKPFIPFNAATIPPQLCESLLFGHRKGTFTGATQDKKGLIMEAHEGTLFIDEIGTLSPEIQNKLLRVLQEREIQPLGDNRSHPVDVRILAATNIDLKGLVANREFREDLYFRLNIIGIHIPPLRDRMEDIPLLAERFVERYAAENQKEIRTINPSFLHTLMAYSWPGNVRELENAIQRAVVLCSDGTLHPYLLPPELLENTSPEEAEIPGAFNARVNDFKRRILIEALHRHNWVQKDVAAELEIRPSTLSELMKRLGIGRSESTEDQGASTP